MQLKMAVFLSRWRCLETSALSSSTNQVLECTWKESMLNFSVLWLRNFWGANMRNECEKELRFNKCSQKLCIIGEHFVREKTQNVDPLLIFTPFRPIGRNWKVKVYEIWQTPAWLWIFSLKNVNDISALFWRLSKAIHNVKHTCVPHYITGGAKLQPHQIFLLEKI